MNSNLKVIFHCRVKVEWLLIPDLEVPFGHESKYYAVLKLIMNSQY